MNEAIMAHINGTPSPPRFSHSFSILRTFHQNKVSNKDNMSKYGHSWETKQYGTNENTTGTGNIIGTGNTGDVSHIRGNRDHLDTGNANHIRGNRDLDTGDGTRGANHIRGNRDHPDTMDSTRDTGDTTRGADAGNIIDTTGTTGSTDTGNSRGASNTIDKKSIRYNKVNKGAMERPGFRIGIS